MVTRAENGAGSVPFAPINLSHLSWLENLKRGLLAILIHPFLPFSEPNFDYKCLFFKGQHCHLADNVTLVNNQTIVENYTTSLANETSFGGYADLLKGHLASALRHFNITMDAKAPTPESDRSIQQADLLSNIARYLQSHNRKGGGLLYIVQLLFCTTALSYYLVQDIKYLINYFKAKHFRI